MGIPNSNNRYGSVFTNNANSYWVNAADTLNSYPNFNINAELNYDKSLARYNFGNQYKFNNPYDYSKLNFDNPEINSLSDLSQYSTDTPSETSGSNKFLSSGLGFGTIRQLGNNIMGRAVNKQYDYLNSPYSQQIKDLYDATQDPIARAVKNWTGKSRDNILNAIYNDTPNEDLFQISINGNDTASLLNNFNYKTHSDEELGIRQNIKQKDFWSAFGDFNNQAGVGALYGAEAGGGWGALAGLATGIGMGINNWIYDRKNTKRFNDAINQSNTLKRMREASYRDDYLAQYNTQAENVAMNDYRNNVRDYYGILKNGGYLSRSFATGGFVDRLKKSMLASSHPQVVYWDRVKDYRSSGSPYIPLGGKSGGGGHSGTWGTVDYIQNTPIPPVERSFSEAFASARAAGLPTFEFNGKLYNTEIDPNFKGAPERYETLTPAMNLRKIYDNVGNEVSDSTKMEIYKGQPVGYIERETYPNGEISQTYIGASPFRDGGSIHIKPENRGKFTALKERTGHSATWFKENGTPAQKKMAVFALNARKWHHNDNGGPLTDEQYFKIMERVAKKNYTDWGFNTPDEALTHALNDNTYNYRAFYNENPEAMNDANTHWPDTYKTVYHPTFSDESKYSGVVDKNYNPYGRIGGVWVRGTFFPNYWQTKYRNGGELGTMDDINNGFIEVKNGGTHEENPLGGVPVNIAEDGLPNLVEEGEMIYDGYVYSNNPQLAPSKDLQKGIGIQGKTYADIIKKAQQYSSERPNDPIAKNYDKYIASLVATDQEIQKQEKQSNMKNKKGIKGHYADWGADLAYYSPLIGTAGQMISDWVGNTNQYDYSGINRAIKEAGTLQAPTYASYYDAGTKAKYNPYDSNYIFNPINNQINANKSMLRYASPTPAALQRNLAATNTSAITALANAEIEGRKYNDALRKEVLGINNALELQRAANKMNVNQFNTNLTNEYRRALAQRNTDMAFRKYGLMNEVDAAVNAARDANRTAFLNNAGEAGKYWKILNMIKDDKSLLYAWLNGDHMTYKGRTSRNGGCIKGRR